MTHGYIYANINGIHVFVVHLSPHSYRKRQSEVREILARAALIPDAEEILVLGDFNALSEDDEEHYDDAFLQVKRESEAASNYIRNLVDGQLDYSVTAAMKEAGFTDSLRVFSSTYEKTYPTDKYRKNVTQRIDYIWLNQALAKRLVSARVVRDESTEAISDHYPVVAEFGGGAEESPETNCGRVPHP